MGDPVSHAAPPSLTGGPGSPDVNIGSMPAWRGVPAGAAAQIEKAKKDSQKAIKAAEAATKAATGTSAHASLKAAEDALKNAQAAAMGALMAGLAGAADQHSCNTPLPPPTHGSGVVVDGSKTVNINYLPACREGDQIVEPVGPPNKISKGFPTVNIGG